VDIASHVKSEHKSNEEVLQQVQVERTLIKTLRTRHQTLIGHILRHET